MPTATYRRCKTIAPFVPIVRHIFGRDRFRHPPNGKPHHRPFLSWDCPYTASFRPFSGLLAVGARKVTRGLVCFNQPRAKAPYAPACGAADRIVVVTHATLILSAATCRSARESAAEMSTMLDVPLGVETDTGSAKGWSVSCGLRGSEIYTQILAICAMLKIIAPQSGNSSCSCAILRALVFRVARARQDVYPAFIKVRRPTRPASSDSFCIIGQCSAR